MTGRRGFVIAADGLMAITIFVVAATIFYAQDFQPKTLNDVHLKQTALDVLTVLEKGGGLANALAGNDTPMRSVIEATPDFACMRIYAVDGNGNVVLSITKSSCNSATNINVATMPMHYGGNNYLLKAESWLREKP